MSNTKLPETTMPETKLSETKMLETTMPETKIPEKKMPEKMSVELPTELLNIIHAYSKPCFLHFREYNRLAKICGPLPLLKEKLQDPAYLPTFLAYEEALMAWRAVKKLPTTPEHSDIFRRLMRAIESL